MTREEKIIQMAKTYTQVIYVVQKTAEKTRKEVISKACEWLEKNRDELSRVNTSGFVELFKKVMEL